MNKEVCLFLSVCCVLLFASAGSPKDQHWVVVWSDEFDGPAHSSPDSSKWGFNTGGGGWGNNELEYYTDRLENAFIDGKGQLAINALQEKYTGPDNVTRNYTSARLITKSKFTQKFGKFEARIKLPFGQGIWPAFWMLGSDIDAAGWPTCGEIDIMENIGREPSANHGSLHGPSYSANIHLPVYTHYRMGSISRIPFMCSQSNGSQQRYASTLMGIYTRPERRQMFPPAEDGSSIIPSSFCST